MKVVSQHKRQQGVIKIPITTHEAIKSILSFIVFVFPAHQNGLSPSEFSNVTTAKNVAGPMNTMSSYKKYFPSKTSFSLRQNISECWELLQHRGVLGGSITSVLSLSGTWHQSHTFPKSSLQIECPGTTSPNIVKVPWRCPTHCCAGGWGCLAELAQRSTLTVIVWTFSDTS